MRALSKEGHQLSRLIPGNPSQLSKALQVTPPHPDRTSILSCRQNKACSQHLIKGKEAILLPLNYHTLSAGDSFLLTDGEWGADYARKEGIGFAVYGEPDFPCSDAQCLIMGFDEVSPDFIRKLYERSRGIPWTILRTKRTLVRELSLDDIDDIYRLHEDPEIQKNNPPLFPSREDEIQFQKAYIEQMYGFYGYGFWLVYNRIPQKIIENPALPYIPPYRKEAGELIGRAGLNHRDGFQEPELGYLFSAIARGKGIAFEVCSAILDYAHEILGFSMINSFIYPDNKRSIRFIEKLGFTFREKYDKDEKLLYRFTKKLTDS